MKLTLKDFQEIAAEELYAEARAASREVGEGGRAQALVLSSPTGSGKTMIATALMERIVAGDDEHAPDEESTFLWLSDAPDLNEQSLRKLRDASTVFGNEDLITIDASFDQATLTPGKVYFLNIQKLGRGTQLVTAGDERNFTL